MSLPRFFHQTRGERDRCEPTVTGGAPQAAVGAHRAPPGPGRGSLVWWTGGEAGGAAADRDGYRPTTRSPPAAAVRRGKSMR